MAEQPRLPRHLSLSERLQGVTEALAATRTPEELSDIVLRPALQALGTLGGVVLLVNETGDCLNVTARQGHPEGGQSLWQDGPLEASAPTGDALRRREALYFEHQGTLTTAYPDLEAQTGGVAAVATAVIPMVLDEQALGVIVVELKAPHDFTPEERRFLQTLAAQCAVALDRMRLLLQLRQQTEKLQTRAEALTAFVTLTEAVELNTDLSELTRRARDVLRATSPDVFMSYYGLDGGRWVPSLLDEVPEDLERVLRAGVSTDTPAYAEAVKAQRPVFIEHWDPEVQRIPHTESFSAGAFAPYFQGGQPVGMLVAGLQGRPIWTPQYRAVLTALWRSLGGALDRAEQARQLEGRDALDAFVALTKAVGTETDLSVLARRAIQVMQAALPEVGAIYYELAGGLWKARVVSEEVAPEIVAVLRAGLPLETPSLMAAIEARGPIFIEGWDPETQGVAHTEAYGAGAFYPYFSQGQPLSLFCVGTQQARTWTARERAMFTAVGRSLGLALERSETARQLEEERSALAAFTAFTESVGTETDVLVLVRQAMALLRETHAVDATYSEREGDLYKIRAWTPDFPPALLARSQVGYSLEQPSFARAARERSTLFLDGWDAEEQNVGESALYGAAAFQPLFQGDELRGMMIMASRSADRWTERDRAGPGHLPRSGPQPRPGAGTGRGRDPTRGAVPGAGTQQ